MHDLKPLLSHYEFQRSIALAWICPSKYWIDNSKSSVVRTLPRSLPTQSTSTTNETTVESTPQNQTTRPRRNNARYSSLNFTTPTTNNATRVTVDTTIATVVTNTSTSTENTKQIHCSRVEDRTLCSGAPLNLTRLNQVYNHFPQPPCNDHAICQLHAWVTTDKKRRYKKNLGYCKHCRVHLCMKCYSRFHTEHDLIAIKNSLTEEYKADNARPRSSKQVK